MLKNIIYIASDHAGFELKQKICSYFKENEINFLDLGTNDNSSCDYPDFAHSLAKKIDNNSFGILICGTGIGISISANRHKNIRCALCNEGLSAKLSRKHNDANVLAIGGRMIGFEQAINIIEIFINTEFDGDRHINRIKKIEVD